MQNPRQVKDFKLSPEQSKFVLQFQQNKQRRDMLEKGLIQRMQEAQQLKAQLHQLRLEGQKLLQRAPAPQFKEVDMGLEG